MTSCTAASASVTTASTRAWSTVPAPRSLRANTAVAERPKSAADGVISVSGCVVVMGISSCGGAVRKGKGCGKSAVLAVARELVRVDLDAKARSGADGQLTTGDLQRLGEQVVGHV